MYLCECMPRERNDFKTKQEKIDSLCFHSSDREKMKCGYFDLIEIYVGFQLERNEYGRLITFAKCKLKSNMSFK